MEPFYLAQSVIKNRPTNIYGLKTAPTLEPEVSDNQDAPAWGWPTGPEISSCNLQVVDDVLTRLGDNCKTIVEIGVNRNKENSITHLLLTKKSSDTVYLGIDIEDKSYLNDNNKNIHTIQANSHDQVAIREKLIDLHIHKIDLFVIDGWHSVNTCINDWLYVKMLSDHGCVVMHDTNAHPGPIALFHSVDESIFEKTRHCISMTDMGIATFWHKKINDKQL